MFPGPIDIPASVDCAPALASTGAGSIFPLIFGLVVLALGITFFVVARGRLRGSGIALGLVLLLGVGGLAVAPVNSAQADSCTPIDYSIDGLIEPDSVEPAIPVPSGQPVAISFDIANVVDRDGTPPIVVMIPKADSIFGPTLTQPQSANWSLDTASDPLNYLITYTGPLPKGTVSSTAEFVFVAENNSCSTLETTIPVSIVTGSGGDTNVANNLVTLPLRISSPPC